jgi:uncharacterized repeat protein (TIGR03803 family)
MTRGGLLIWLHSFDGTDGANPTAGLVLGTDGNFYGTTSGGGNYTACAVVGCGTVFKITAGGLLSTLHSFDLTDGLHPYAALVQGSDGYFYGTTNGLADCSVSRFCGTVFRISPSGALKTLHDFFLSGDGSGTA